MALIRCPECKHEVSTEAKVCPHCGFPIKEYIDKKVEEKLEKNIYATVIEDDSSWEKQWFSRMHVVKVAWTIIFLGLLAAFIAFITLLINDKEVVRDNFGYITEKAKTNHIVLSIFFGIASFASLVIWLSLLIVGKVTQRGYQGHKILVYSAFCHCLIIDGKEVSRSILNRHLYGNLPNNIPVVASISFWDGSILIQIDGK